MARDPYLVLGISRGATTAEIAAAWKARVVALHPDKYPGASASHLEKLHDQLAEVHAAYESIRNGGAPTSSMHDLPRRDVIPMAPRRTLTRKQRRVRWGIAVTVGALILAWLIMQNPSSSTPSHTTVPAGWVLGNCVAQTATSPDVVEPVHCGQPHIGKIVDVVYETSACPAKTGGTVQRGAEYYCIDYEQ